MSSDRRTSVVVAAAGALAFLALAALLVPWQPVPGGWPPPAAADTVFPAEQIARAEEFSRWARTWSWASLGVGLLVAVWLGVSRTGRSLVNRIRGPWWLRVVLAVAALSLIGRLVTFPFAGLLHRHLVDYGLSTQSWSEWLLDVAKSELIGIVVGSIVVLVLVGSARRWPRAWPAVAGGVLGLLVLAGSFVYPVLVEPMFNSFRPLPDGSLRTQIVALAERERVQVDDVLVADASRRTTTLNAYVSGFGSTRRVVVYDNLVEDLPEDQALSVVAHELAHARNRDVLAGSVLGLAGTVAGTGLLGLVVGSLARRRRWPDLADVTVVPLLLALIAVGGVLGAPVQNTISRQIETRADVDALTATGDPDAFAGMQERLATRSLSDPTPPAWAQFWFGSHPTTLQRIGLARAWPTARPSAP